MCECFALFFRALISLVVGIPLGVLPGLVTSVAVIIITLIRANLFLLVIIIIVMTIITINVITIIVVMVMIVKIIMITILIIYTIHTLETYCIGLR